MADKPKIAVTPITPPHHLTHAISQLLALYTENKHVFTPAEQNDFHLVLQTMNEEMQRHHLTTLTRPFSKLTAAEYKALHQRCLTLAASMFLPGYEHTVNAKKEIYGELAALHDQMYMYDLEHPIEPLIAVRANAFQVFQEEYRRLERERERELVQRSQDPSEKATGELSATCSSNRMPPQRAVTRLKDQDARKAEQALYNMMRRAYIQSYVRDYPMPSFDEEE